MLHNHPKGVWCNCQSCQQGVAAWGETPWWHPYRLFGLDMRQRIVLDRIDGVCEVGWWHYGRSRRLAHELLRRTYDPVDTSEIG